MNFKLIIENLKKYLEIILAGLILFISVISLFVGDFNLLKILVTLIILLSLNLLGVLFYLKQKKPKEIKLDIWQKIFEILENFQEGVVIYNSEMKIIYANKKFFEIVKLDKEKIIGQTVGQWMINNEVYKTLGNIFFPFIEGEEVKIISEKPLETISVKFSQPEEKYFLISFSKINLEKEDLKIRLIIDRTNDVIESQKKLEFIQLISHNLLTPLSETRWLLESLDFETLQEETRKIIEDALYIIRSTIIFSQSTLTFVKSEQAEIKLNISEIKFDELINKVLTFLKRKILEKSLEVKIEIYEKANQILGDENLLFLVFSIIIENAIVYNKSNGSIFIKAQKENRPYVLIEIQDTGIGMSSTDLENIFKKYYRGEKAKEYNIQGFGIGLYLAKKIIEKHGGKINIESKENLGTKVTIELPLDKSLIPDII